MAKYPTLTKLIELVEFEEVEELEELITELVLGVVVTVDTDVTVVVCVDNAPDARIAPPTTTAIITTAIAAKTVLFIIQSWNQH
ncbi:MAG TPA: hypothetical protein VED17_02910, partial [Nitrososphaerales archaeon]|nr:hypothetical protein [Nitrososphaerales archaeon]